MVTLAGIGQRRQASVLRLRLVFLVATLICLGGCERTNRAGQVADAADTVRPLLPGMAAPEFVARRADGTQYRFDPASLSAPVVLSFYRGGWCPFCNRQLALLRQVEGELRELGFEVLFLSADRPELLYPSLEDPEIKYTLLSDSQMTVARDFGVAFTVDSRTLARYEEVGIDLQAASGADHHQLPVPATFIIGRDGTIVFSYANPNYKVRLNGQILLAAARAHLSDEKD